MQKPFQFQITWTLAGCVPFPFNYALFLLSDVLIKARNITTLYIASNCFSTQNIYKASIRNAAVTRRAK